jgi:hypothetical protein
MKERRIPANKYISEHITITVAEYHFLTKAATLLEAAIQAESYQRDGALNAAERVLWGITGSVGAEE